MTSKLKNSVNPLDWQVPIADSAGKPTPEFQRKWSQQAVTNGAIPLLDTAAEVSAVLDVIAATAGAVLVRGTMQWAGLASPSDATKFLNGAASPAYAKVKDTDLAVTNVTGNNVSTAAHGFAPKLPNDATKFLNGVGAYTVPASAGANPTATASDTAVNGTATTFLRSDGAPAVQKATVGQFGLVKPDGTTITIAAGVISSSGGGGGGYPPGTPPTIVQSAASVAASNSITLGAAPTSGNLLVAMCFNPTTSTAGTGWTKQTENITGTDFGEIMTKVAGASESATQSPMGGSTPTRAGIVIWELHGQAAAFFVSGVSQAEAATIQNNGPVLPNLTNCLSLSAGCLASSSLTIASALNITQDQLINTGTSRIVGGHSTFGTAPLAQLLLILSAAGSSKIATCLITS